MFAQNPLRNMAIETWWTISLVTMLVGCLALGLGYYCGYPLVTLVGAVVVAFGKFGVPYCEKKAERAKEQEAAEEKAKTSPFLRVSYQRQASNNGNDSIIIAFENTGNGPIEYFTASIESNGGNFQIGQLNGVKTSGISGSWTTISGTNLLPQTRAFVSLSLVDANTELKPPDIKSDSEFQFVGESRIGPFSWHPNEGST